MSEHHRKAHYAIETTDAYADGWDAHEARPTEQFPAGNPYHAELQRVAAGQVKPAVRQLRNLRRDARLWDQGWIDWANRHQWS